MARAAPRRAHEAVKDTKYKPLAAARGSTFKPAVIERGGAFGDSLVSAIKMLTPAHSHAHSKA